MRIKQNESKTDEWKFVVYIFKREKESEVSERSTQLNERIR